jgi:hypothetical protein
MYRLTHDIMIDEGPDAVWAFLGNLRVSLSCNRFLDGFSWAAAPRPEPGCRFTFDLNLMGFRLHRDCVITQWEPPDRLALAEWSAHLPGRWWTQQHRFIIDQVAGRPDVTLMTYTVVGNLAPWPVELPFRVAIRSNMLDYLVNLKRAIESSDKSGLPRKAAAGRLASMPT